TLHRGVLGSRGNPRAVYHAAHRSRGPGGVCCRHAGRRDPLAPHAQHDPSRGDTPTLGLKGTESMAGDGRATRAGTPPAGAAVGELRLTAAICTRGRPEQLGRALESLSVQRVGPSEILVIDNAPQDDAAERTVARVCPAARYVVEPVPGLDFARNRALAEADGDIVA